MLFLRICNGGSTSRFIGGFIGANYGGEIRNCYSTANYAGRDSNGYISGFIGYIGSGILVNCVHKETTMQSTYTDLGWDFDGVWWINDERDYPRLSWQPFGDVNNDCRVDIVDLGIMGANWGMDISGAGVDKRCELSGDDMIGVEDFSELINMWLEGPQFTD